MGQLPVICRSFTPKCDVNASSAVFSVEGYPDKRKECFLLLCAKVTDDLKASGPHLISLAEIV
jgi:hypothetical protein